MTGRTVPFSVRVSHEDADFLASYNVDGAETPSEKLRALIGEARRRQDSTGGFSESQTELRRIIQPLIDQVRDYEANNDQYSQIVHLGVEWIPEAMADLVSHCFKQRGALNDEDACQLERRITDRVFRLIEGFLRLAVTQDCEGYDSQVVQKRLPRIRQLLELMRMMEDGGTS